MARRKSVVWRKDKNAEHRLCRRCGHEVLVYEQTKFQLCRDCKYVLPKSEWKGYEVVEQTYRPYAD